MVNETGIGQPTIDQFVDRLVEEKGFANVEADVLEQIKKDLKDRIEDRINASILEHLPPARLEEFEKLLDESSQEEVQAFCEKHVPDLPAIVANALIGFRQLYLNI